MEHLEQRVLLTADPLVSCGCDSEVVSLTWQGQQVEAVRDSWVMRMPTPANPLSVDFYGYQSRAPRAPAGWAVESLNYGFYSVHAPGASEQSVSGWGRSIGALAVEPNFVFESTATPDDPFYADGSLWGLDTINAPTAWDTVTGSSSIVLGVVDSGVDVTHPDLADNIWVNPGETPGNGIDDDGNGFIDDINGWNFGDDDADLTDNVGHGTHVAGTMGAVGNNAIGVAGVNWASSLMVLKLGDIPTSARATSAINYVTSMRGRGIPIVATNNSYGNSFSTLFESAIRLNNDAGVIFVAAAGNSSSNNDLVPAYPANYNSPNIITVAASDEFDALASFSNYGATTVDIAAPGVGILSTEIPSDDPSGYGLKSGTSMAAPHVAGVAGLLAAAYYEATGELPSVADLRSALLDGAERIPTVPGVSGLTNPATRGVVVGNRRLDATGSLETLLGANVSVRVLRPSAREGDAGTKSVEFSVRLAKPALLEPVEVSYTTVDGTAIAGEDYEATSGTLIFEPGEQFKTVTVQVYGDTELEESETFQFALTDVLNGRLGVQQTAEYTIVNDEAPLVTIAPSVALEDTGRRTAVDFVVTVNGEPEAPVMVSYGTRDGTAVARRDYVPTRGMLVFRPGELSKTISVKVVGDRVPEADEVFYLVIAGARNGTLPEESQEIPGYIIDDDSRVVSVSALAPSVAGGTDASFRIAVDRVGAAGAVFPELPEGLEMPPLTISATYGTVSLAPLPRMRRALAGSDYTPVFGTVAFDADTLEHTVTVGTSTVDRSAAFTMRLSQVVGASIGEATAATTILAAGDDGSGDGAFAETRPGRRRAGGWAGPWWRRLARRR